ncbi:acyltransferase [Hyphomicrobium sp. LHD-15]|uniref:acyltransferase family protein n=1 Tax=Hyphomicrobium sp. LHD-15 TaxID=3072142 RepID=UPI00280EFBF3|nr:acyltransferase [Hyphomicrobium sp. LHD-15]MDQ8700614.1 acyltransferase [Hyphomicrobium sp. LHD-15]
MIRNIQMLRGIAAMLVVLCHATLQWGSWLPWLKSYAFAAGFTGVDLFFVISGYVISRSAVAASENKGRLAGAADFGFNRAARIYPLYWVVLAASMVAAFAITGSVSWGKPASLWHAIALTGGNPIVSVAWTLRFEIWFYSLVTVLILITPAQFIRWALGTFALAYGGLLIWAQVTGFSYGILLFPVVLDFLFGILVFLYLDKGWKVPPAATVAIGIVGLCIGTYLMMGNSWSKADLRPYYLGIPAAILVAGMVALEPKRSAPRLFVSMGDASYSTYLWHWPILYGATMAKVSYPGPLTVAAILIVIPTLGWLSFRFIERPIAGWIAKRRRGISLALTRKAPVPA